MDKFSWCYKVELLLLNNKQAEKTITFLVLSNAEIENKYLFLYFTEKEYYSNAPDQRDMRSENIFKICLNLLMYIVAENYL